MESGAFHEMTTLPKGDNKDYLICVLELSPLSATFWSDDPNMLVPSLGAHGK